MSSQFYHYIFHSKEKNTVNLRDYFQVCYSTLRTILTIYNNQHYYKIYMLEPTAICNLYNM